MTAARLLLVTAFAIGVAGCDQGVRAAAPAPAAPQPPALVPVVVQAAPAKTPDDLPACSDPAVHALVKEAFIRRVLVEGDNALLQRGALEAADAFTEAEIVQAMPRMLALARLEQVAEQGQDAPHRRRCTGRLAVDGWADLSPPATFQIVPVQDAARWGVESRVQLLPGAEGFNMVIGYRSTFGKLVRL